MTQPSGSFRDESDAISPNFWRGPVGTKLRYSMSVLYDGLSDAAAFAVEAGSPSIAPVDALPYASIDRQILPGFQESTTSLRARLLQWADRWAYSGTAIGVLLFAKGWILPQLPNMYVVTNAGTWWNYGDGVDPMPPGSQTVAQATVQTTSGLWNWDGHANNWWRSWLIIFSTDTSWCSQTQDWSPSGKKWGDATISWGFASPPSVFAGLSALVQQVKRAGQWYPYVIVCFDDAAFNPSTSDPTKLPDGHYGRWSKIVNGQYVSSRNTIAARYIGVAP
jgi:hypothetical protein